MYCKYTKNFLNKIANFNLDFKKIKQAIGCIKYYHAGQRRDSGEPYYSHPIIVASMVADYLPETDIIITALLHDTLEDTSLTKEKIEQLFGHEVANNVYDLTRNKDNGIKISAREIIENLWREKKLKLLIVKQFDRMHNIMTLDAKTDEKANEIMNETVETFIVLAEYFKTTNVSERIIDIYHKIKRRGSSASNESNFSQDQYLLSLIFQSDEDHT